MPHPLLVYLRAHKKRHKAWKRSYQGLMCSNIPVGHNAQQWVERSIYLLP